MAKTFSQKNLIDLAKKARKSSYSPYSGCQVGAAVLLESGQTYSGCNIENSSYGGTICAERGAIQTALCHSGLKNKFKIKAVAVVTQANPPWPPCGLCRQVIAEFSSPETSIIMANTHGASISMPFKDLFPKAFLPSHLTKTRKK